MKGAQKVNTKNLQKLCWRNGFDGVPALAARIGRDRVTVWRAVRWPDQFGPTYKLILEALNGD